MSNGSVKSIPITVNGNAIIPHSVEVEASYTAIQWVWAGSPLGQIAATVPSNPSYLNQTGSTGPDGSYEIDFIENGEPTAQQQLFYSLSVDGNDLGGDPQLVIDPRPD